MFSHEVLDVGRDEKQMSPGRRPGSRARMIARSMGALVLSVTMLAARRVPGAPVDTITVCAGGSCDYTTIQQAIDADSTAASDTINLLDAVHTEAGIVVNKSVSIVGAGGLETIVQAATNPSAADDRVFTVASGVSVTIQDVTVRHGRVTGSPAHGGGILNLGTLMLERSIVSANRAEGSGGSLGSAASGGGIYNGGLMTVVRSTISDNAVEGGDGSPGDPDGGDGHGGGVANSEDGVLVVINSTISDNSVDFGRGYG